MQVAVIPEKPGDNILPVPAIYISENVAASTSVRSGAIEEALYERF